MAIVINSPKTIDKLSQSSLDQLIDLSNEDDNDTNVYYHSIEGLDDNITKKYITCTNSSKYNIFNSRHTNANRKKIIEYFQE